MRRLPAGVSGAAVVAAVTFLPFARGLLQGRSLYFRDLSMCFFPPRLYAAEGIRDGVVRYWNPFIHEGVLASLPPLSYPIDALQALAPVEWWLSLLLALHVPLGAVAFYSLCRRVLGGDADVAAATGGIAYGLGGFMLSSVNLYVYVEAMAWAPLIVLGMIRAVDAGRRAWLFAAAAVAVGISTTGIEVVLQALVVGVVCAVPAASPRRVARLLPPVALGAALAAPTIVFMGQLVAGTARSVGFETEVVLAYSVHPLTLPQILVGSWHGRLANFTGEWWGQNFFTRGFPYLLSLYLGAVVVALAATAAVSGARWRGRLTALAAVALVVCLGRWVGLSWLVDSLPPLHKLRYPVKAFFTVHFVVALLAAFGARAIERDASAARRFVAIAAALGGVLAALGLVPLLAPRSTAWFLAGFLPPGEAWPLRLAQLGVMIEDARVGGILALAAAAVAVCGLRGLLAPRAAGLAVAALVAVDLVRTGAGLNPMVTSSFYRLSDEMAAEVQRMKQEGGRLFTCDVDSSLAYRIGRTRHAGNHEGFTFGTTSETLTPNYNIGPGVATAYSRDLTALTPIDRAFTWDEGDCHDFGLLVDRLRDAAVHHVISLDPLDHPSLRLRRTVASGRIAPVGVHVYELTESRPEWSVVPREGTDGSGAAAGTARLVSDESGDVLFEVEAREPASLLVRRGHARGWRATVDGVSAVIDSGPDRRRQAVAVPVGRSRVRLRYSPPYGRAAWVVAVVVAAGLVWLHRRRPS